MIAFAVFLLGLISGVYPFEVKVSDDVRAVEFVLDGTAVARAEAPPWVARVDLGKGVQPRQLVARALDAEGREVARTTQWLNLPRPPAEVDIVLEKNAAGQSTAAQLTWQSKNGVEPVRIGLYLDGRPLPVDAGGRAALPETELKTLHVLTAELWFPPGLTARKDVVFGGEYGSEVSTELTAVPLRLAKDTVLPAPKGLQGWLTAGGEPVPVAAVEDTPGKVIVVRVPSSQETMGELMPRRTQGFSKGLRNEVRQGNDLHYAYRNEMRLGKEDRVRFLSLSSHSFRDSRVPSELFDFGPNLTWKDGGMFWFLTNTGDLKNRGQRAVADAVAVAGLQAAAENHRRAVVLLLDGDAEDDSRYDPATVRRYLESVRVPLYVWSLYGAKSPAIEAWGGAVDVSSIPKLATAVARLREDLASQQIVWIEGRHLPQSVTLTPAARGVELAGAP